MTFDELMHRKREIRDEAARKLRQLEADWVDEGGDPRARVARVRLAKSDTILAETIEAIEHLPKGQPFDINAVADAVEQRNEERRPLNPTTVSGILRRLASHGYLRLSRPGRGSRPSEYRTVSSVKLRALLATQNTSQ